MEETNLINVLLISHYLSEADIKYDSYPKLTPKELVDRVVADHVDLWELRVKIFTVTGKVIAEHWLKIVVDNLVNRWLWDTLFQCVDGKDYSIMEWFTTDHKSLDEWLEQ